MRAGSVGQVEVVASRLARRVAVILVILFVAFVALGIAMSGGSRLAVLAGLAVLTVHAALLVPNVLGTRHRWWPWTLGAQALLTYLPPLLWPHVTGLWGLTVFLAGACLLYLRPPFSWLCFALVTVSTVPLVWRTEPSVRAAVYGLLGTAVVGCLLAAMAWLHRLATDLPVTEGRLAAIEVARERRRLLRDAHDLLSFRLSATVLKIELARRADASTAHAELAEARTQALAALAEARALSAGLADLSLRTELGSARALLSTAQIELNGPAEPPDLPQDVDVVLATVLREAVTNLLRHSTTGRCSIELTADARAVRLVISNDGVGRPGDQPHGTGLASLTDRVAALGGRLTVRSSDDLFTLAVRVPTRHATASGPSTPLLPTFSAVLIVGLLVLALPQAEPAIVDPLFVFLALASGAGLYHLCRPRLVARRPAAWWLVLAALVLLAYAPLLRYPADSWVMRHYLGAAFLLLLRGRVRWLACAAVLVAELLLATAGTFDPGSLIYHLTADVDDASALFALAQLPLLAGALALAQARLATTEVARERSRFADQLSERLGERLGTVLHTLTLLEKAPDAQLLNTALELARAAATDLRSVAASTEPEKART